MARLHQYDYLFAIGTIFAFLDAWNIGANDVANSWANAVAARSLTYVQAMIGASIMEFAGSFGVGARVSDTIRTKIVDTKSYAGQPALLMLGMVCAVVASSSFLTVATKLGLPVSTTHSLIGGILGMGIASVGADNIQWVGDKSKGGTAVIKDGVVQVFIAWIVAPVLSGVFASLLFLTAKYLVLIRQNSVMRGLYLVPVYFGVTGMLISMLLVWKGGSYKVNLTEAQIPGVVVAAGAAWGILVGIFLCPWLYRVVIKEDWQLRWYHIFQGPLLLRRGEVPPPPANYQGPIRNYYEGHLTKEELDARRAAEAARRNSTVGPSGEKVVNSDASDQGDGIEDVTPKHKSLVGPKPDGPWYSGARLFWLLKFALLNGVDQDVISSQGEKSALGGDVRELHAHSAHYDNRTEFLYTFMQIMTSSAASFVHGANDVSNAIGPYATIFEIWNTGKLGDKAQVPLWILAFGGGAIVIGLWTYGYNIMRNLGNRITLQSPSRGFSMELGSVIAIIIATRLKLPVSTTQCITGAIVGVGFCNGTWRSINWRMVSWIYFGWFITLPVTGIISGCIMGIIINAPRWGFE